MTPLASYDLPHAFVTEAELWAIAEDLQARIDALMDERGQTHQPELEL